MTADTTLKPGALDGLRVLDLGGMPSMYASKLLADFGATVTLLEGPDGDAARRLPPFAGGVVDGERSLVFHAFHANKRSALVDITTPEGQEQVRQLAQSADVLIETNTPGYMDGIGLGSEALRSANPRLIVCSVTPYGQTGPFASYKGTDLHAEAMGGLMMLQGDPERQPVMSPAFLGYSVTGTHAAIGIMNALFSREHSGAGQHVDVSMQEAIANILFIVSQYGYNGTIAQRPGAGAGGGTGVFECSDGWIGFSPIQPSQFKAFGEWTENAVLQDEMFKDLSVRSENAEFINGIATEFLLSKTVAQAVEEAQSRRIPATPVSTPADLANNPHLLFRDYFQDVEHPVVGAYRLPGPTGRLSETPWAMRRPAPTLGQHTDEVLAEAVAAPFPASSSAPMAHPGNGRLPLEGVRVTDLTRIWVGPYGTRQVADFGAEVIKIESSLFDPASRITGLLPMHPELNRNKMSITVDLHHTDGQAIVRKLASTSDAVVENYAAGALNRWGLDYEGIRAVKPDIVYMSMPGWGSTGPFASHVLFGLQAQTASGVTHLWGHPESTPDMRCGVYYADFFVGGQSGFMLQAALYHRQRTGQGQHIEVSQVEAQANALGVPLLDYYVNGVNQEPAGNRRDYAAPHDAYLCLGDDAWCVIACHTQEEWEGLARAMTPPRGEVPAWTQDARFSTPEERLANRDALDEELSNWTRTLTPRQVMFTLQRHGVPAAACQTTEDTFFDPALNARGYVVTVNHPEPEWGALRHASFGASLSDTPGAIRMGAPGLGQHNEYVMRELLGYSESDVRELVESKILV